MEMKENDRISQDAQGENPSKPSGNHQVLQKLRVIDRLEVGPIRLEKRRFTAPYRVHRADESSTFDLEYRYEEDVFNPDDSGDQNLANMIAAQVALNYGLFCDEILFHGNFDPADQKFLSEMAANTAREIYVKKFLESNPFLKEPWRDLPAIKIENYSQARLRFQPSETATQQTRQASKKAAQNWETNRARHAILSSGGKDSLLSYSLLNEIGFEVHPIFVNESGRHWFTALNAYRYFKATYPETSRVWTNADRVFAWMLRQLPFIRPDFARVRSDEYPVRLWTVAVFLFGSLPLLKKRNIGRLIIGDEFDTTVRRSFKGIPHYDGLFDQSRYFDNALSRYFQRKGWGVSQFSILRPLSEMLIEKILVERYPEHQRHQVSCHAAHIENERVLPCGRCEKCRRIVGMLKAIGTDPGRCGYSDSQIDECLKSFADQSAHQEAAGAQQLAYLLKQKQLIPPDSKSGRSARLHPEIMQIRIDPDKSPIECIPVDLRESLFNIFLAHAEGAVTREGRTWRTIDLLNSEALHRPYPFEATISGNIDSKVLASHAETVVHGYLLGELTWPEARTRFKEVDLALLPVGAIEQHGPHLPIDTDAFDADYLSREVASRCSYPKPLVLPLIPYGVSYHHSDFSGTLSISNETLSKIVYEVGMSAARNGITKFVIINGHGGNAPALQFAAQMINRDAHIFTCVDSGESSDTDIGELADTLNDVHAGEIETSTTLANRPHLVRMDKAKKYVPKFSNRYLDFSSKRSVEWYAKTEKISSSGVMGDPTRATQEKGERMWAVMIKNLVEFIEDLKSMTLDEIHARKL